LISSIKTIISINRPSLRAKLVQGLLLSEPIFFKTIKEKSLWNQFMTMRWKKYSERLLYCLFLCCWFFIYCFCKEAKTDLQQAGTAIFVTLNEEEFCGFWFSERLHYFVGNLFFFDNYSVRI
jgi:hypothetical protein